MLASPSSWMVFVESQPSEYFYKDEGGSKQRLRAEFRLIAPDPLLLSRLGCAPVFKLLSLSLVYAGLCDAPIDPLSGEDVPLSAPGQGLLHVDPDECNLRLDSLAATLSISFRILQVSNAHRKQRFALRVKIELPDSLFCVAYTNAICVRSKHHNTASVTSRKWRVTSCVSTSAKRRATKTPVKRTRPAEKQPAEHFNNKKRLRHTVREHDLATMQEIIRTPLSEIWHILRRACDEQWVPSLEERGAWECKSCAVKVAADAHFEVVQHSALCSMQAHKQNFMDLLHARIIQRPTILTQSHPEGIAESCSQAITESYSQIATESYPKIATESCSEAVSQHDLIIGELEPLDPLFPHISDSSPMSNSAGEDYMAHDFLSECC